MSTSLPLPCDGCTYGTGSVWCCPTTDTGSGGGTTVVGNTKLEGHGHPADVIGIPTTPTVMWDYYDHDTVTWFLWSVLEQAWI